MNKFEKVGPELPTQKEKPNNIENIEDKIEKPVEESFNRFLELNGQELLKFGDEGAEILYDTTDEVIKKMNLSKKDKEDLMDYINSFIESKGDSGKDILNEESKKYWKQKKEEKDKQKERERYENLSSEEKLTEDIKKTNSPKELYELLQNLGRFVQGSEKQYTPEEILSLMQGLVNADKNTKITHITRKNGLREKALDFLEHRISNTNTIDDLRKMLKKLDNLEEYKLEELSKKLDKIESGKYVDYGQGSIEDKDRNKDQFGIIKRANEIMGLTPKRKKAKPWTDLKTPPKGWNY